MAYWEPNPVLGEAPLVKPGSSLREVTHEIARVTRLAKFDRQYHLLSELGTHPRTTYLGKIRNPNPAMEQG